MQRVKVSLGPHYIGINSSRYASGSSSFTHLVLKLLHLLRVLRCRRVHGLDVLRVLRLVRMLRARLLHGREIVRELRLPHVLRRGQFHRLQVLSVLLLLVERQLRT